MKAQLFQRRAVHEPIQSNPGYSSVLPVNDPAVVNQPAHVEERIAFYQDWVLQNALQDMDWTFEPVTPGLLIEWLLQCPAWRDERGSYFTSTKQRIIKTLVGNLLHLQQHATGADITKTADRKGSRRTFQGFSLVVEYPKGSTRKGTAPDGTKWEREMVHDYGHFVGIDAADGDSLDCYLGPDDTSDFAYVINQLKKDGSFDEHKILLGFNSVHEAIAGYLAHMPRDWTSFDPIRVLTMAELRHWLHAGDQMSKVAAALPPEVQALVDEFEGKGVAITLYGGTDYLTISAIVVPKDKRGQGLGSHFMQRLGIAADKLGLTVFLTPSTDLGATSVARLRRFYGQFGFKRNMGRNKDFRSWDAMVRQPKQRNRTAASYTPDEVPKNFWLAITLGNETFRDLELGHLFGIRGISGSPAILDAFLPSADAFLRMPGAALERANSLSQVLYDSPEYLLSQNMAALRRVCGGTSSANVIGLVIGGIRDWSAGELFGNWLRAEHKVPVINSVEDFERKVLPLVKDFELADPTERGIKLGLEPGHLREAVKDFCRKTRDTYGFEGEWVVKNQTLNIPPGTHIGILLPGAFNEPAEAMAFYTQAVEAAGGDFAKAHWETEDAATRELLGLIHQALALKEHVAGRYTVGFVVRGHFNPLANQRHERRREEIESGARPSYKNLYKQVAAWKGKTAAPDMDFQRWFKAIGGWDGIDRAWGSDWQEHYFERAAEEVDARDEQALKEQAREFILEDLGDSYAHWDYKYHYLVKFPCKLFRAVDLNDPNALSTSGIGIYWTDSPSHAIAHWGGHGSTYVLEAEVTEDAVDWDGTILANMDPSTGQDEQEIRLKAGAQIKLLGYRSKNKGFGAPNEFVPLEAEAVA